MKNDNPHVRIGKLTERLRVSERETEFWKKECMKAREALWALRSILKETSDYGNTL